MKGTLKEHMLAAPVGGGFSMDGYWVWCASVIRGEDGRYHMFASRWRNTLPMHPGWLLESEVVRAVSDTPCGPYTFEEVVLPARGPAYWDGRATHNPHIMKYGDTYVLYYMGTTHPFADVQAGEAVANEDPRVICARANKRIGIATSKSVCGPWERRDAPVLGIRPDHFDNFLVSNPAPCHNEEERVLLMYKSRGYKCAPYVGLLHGEMEIGIAVADSFAGPYQAMEKPLFAKGAECIEDPFIWKDGDGYHMMAKDMRGVICGEVNGGVYASSQDGLAWRFEKGKVFYSRRILWDDGVEREMANLERPFLLFEDGKPICAFFATGEGVNDDSFGKLKRTWNMAVPLDF